MQTFQIGDKVLAVVQIDYQMREVIGTIRDIHEPGLSGVPAVLDCGEWEHYIQLSQVLRLVSPEECLDLRFQDLLADPEQ